MTEPQASPPSVEASKLVADEVDKLLQRADVVLSRESCATATRWLARAPACFDVIGGIAEYSGAGIVTAPIACGVAVTVRLRDDKKITLHRIGESSLKTPEPISFDLEWLAGRSVGEFADAITGDVSLRAAAGAVLAIFAGGKMGDGVSGATIVVDVQHPFLVDAGTTASSALATTMALVRAWGMHFDPNECAQLAMRAENEVVGFPCGDGPALSALYARRDCLTQIDCQTKTAPQHWTLPEGITLIGIDCGHRHDDADEKYARARTTAFMGRMAVDRILKATDLDGHDWQGLLARVRVADYSSHLKDHLPMRTRGADFIGCFGPTADRLTCIDPDAYYRIRSRTEHHIHEGGRTRDFATQIALSARPDGRASMIKAGKIMRRSHWSYGQRCALGSVETDRLASLLRKNDTKDGVYGARVSGHGSGGLVVVLMEAGDEARQKLNGVLSEYDEFSGQTATIHEGTSHGALEFGVHEV